MMQTGSGKTHTMVGPEALGHPNTTEADAGLIPRAITKLFHGMLDAPEGVEFTCQGKPNRL